MDAAVLSITPHDWGPYKGTGTGMGHIGKEGNGQGKRNGQGREEGQGEREGEDRTVHGVAHTASQTPLQRTGQSHTTEGRKTGNRRDLIVSYLPVMGLDLMLCERVSHVRTYGSNTTSCFSLRNVLGTLDHRFRTQLSVPQNRFKITTNGKCARSELRASAAELLKCTPTATHYLINSKNQIDKAALESAVDSRLFRLIVPDGNGSNSRTSAVRILTASLLSLSCAVTGESELFATPPTSIPATSWRVLLYCIVLYFVVFCTSSYNIPCTLTLIFPPPPPPLPLLNLESEGVLVPLACNSPFSPPLSLSHALSLLSVLLLDELQSLAVAWRQQVT
jgi:hypothetical protein